MAANCSLFFPLYFYLLRETKIRSSLIQGFPKQIWGLINILFNNSLYFIGPYDFSYLLTSLELIIYLKIIGKIYCCFLYIIVYLNVYQVYGAIIKTLGAYDLCPWHFLLLLFQVLFIALVWRLKWNSLNITGV